MSAPRLTHTEEAILGVLAARPGEFVPPETLMVEGLAYAVPVDASRAVRAHISNMRAKGIDIVAGRGRGYYLASAGGVELPESATAGNAPAHGCGRCGREERFDVPRPSRARRARVSHEGRTEKTLFNALLAAGWVRVGKPCFWVCPGCVAPHEAEMRAQAARELRNWRAANAAAGGRSQLSEVAP